MFIIERRTAGVFAALAIPAALALFSSAWDGPAQPAAEPSAVATPAVAPSAPADARPITTVLVRREPGKAAEQEPVVR